MIHERIYLDENKEAYIDTYVSELRFVTRPAMLVIPGGGYKVVCADREGEAVAEAYLARGFNAFVLKYRTGDEHHYPEQLIDAARAMLHIRANAERYNVDPCRVFAVGFSAGAHLAGTLALLSGDPVVLDTLGVCEKDIKPQAIVLSYPVVSAYSPTHEGSFVNLLGKPFDLLTEDERDKYSLECNVTPDSPPAFIWHTSTDPAVPPLGSMRLASAYIDAGATVSLHLYPYGVHGIALADEFSNSVAAGIQPLAQRWVDDSVDFIKSLKYDD